MVEHHGSFVWYELMTTDMAAARDVLRQRRGLGRAGRVDAGSGLHPVYRWKWRRRIPADVCNGSKAKYSLRADVFRFALNSGHAVASPP